jgi:hypothetical protein
MFDTVRINTISTIGVGGVGSRLGRINVMTKATAGGTLSVYDDTSAVAGSLLFVVDTTVNQCYVIDKVLKRGLFLAMAVAAADVSVSYA